MRRYIRLATNIPVAFQVSLASAHHEDYACNVSQGGLCFRSPVRISPGSAIQIEIAVIDPVFRAEGVVVWCHRNDAEGGFAVGVCFEGGETAQSLRMVDQASHIEYYRQGVLRREGRDLSGDEAAREWNELFGTWFP